jgi:hypothetical protein
MGKVYIATSGCYSDYGINAVFSARELAEEFVATLDPREGRVEEYELDEGTRALAQLRSGLAVYYVDMDRDGNAEGVKRDDRPNPYIMAQVRSGPAVHTVGPQGPSPKKRLRGYVMAEHDMHAVKIMNEHRARLIAEGGWE